MPPNFEPKFVFSHNDSSFFLDCILTECPNLWKCDPYTRIHLIGLLECPPPCMLSIGEEHVVRGTPTAGVLLHWVVISRLWEQKKNTLFPNFARFCTPKRCTRVQCLVLKNNPNYVKFLDEPDTLLDIRVAPRECIAHYSLCLSNIQTVLHTFIIMPYHDQLVPIIGIGLDLIRCDFKHAT